MKGKRGVKRTKISEEEKTENGKIFSNAQDTTNEQDEIEDGTSAGDSSTIITRSAAAAAARACIPSNSNEIMTKLHEATSTKMAKRSRLDEIENLVPIPSTSSECTIVRIEPNGSITSILVPESDHGMDVFEFASLMRKVEKSQKSTLLLDCRDSECFNFQRRVNFLPCVNVNLSQQNVIDANVGFPSKASVIKFIFQIENHANLLQYLNSPDHYTDIIVLDENSTTQDSSIVVKSIIAAMNKWTENTATKVKLLQGGIETMSKAYPDKVITPPHKELDNFSVAEGKPLEAGVGVASPELESYLLYWDNAISYTKTIIDLKSRLVGLEVIKSVLLQEQESNLASYLHSQLSDDVKCATCTKVFTREIIQCANGHCICVDCWRKISFCPECQLSYHSVGVFVGTVRNRGLERLLKNTLSVSCQCGENVKCTDTLSHVKQCVNGKLKLHQVELIENQLESAQIDLALETEKLGQVNKWIGLSEICWYMVGGNGHPQISPNEKKIIMERIRNKQMRLNELKVQLLSSVLF